MCLVWKSPTKIENIRQWEVFSLKKNTFEWQDARSEVNSPLGGKSDQKYHLLFWSQSWLNKLHSHIWGNIPLNRKIPKESFFSPKIVKIGLMKKLLMGQFFSFVFEPTLLRWGWSRFERDESNGESNAHSHLLSSCLCSCPLLINDDGDGGRSQVRRDVGWDSIGLKEVRIRFLVQWEWEWEVQWEGEGEGINRLARQTGSRQPWN